MLRKCICLLWAACMVMGTAGQAQAGEQTGTIRIRPEWCSTPIAGGSVSISRVGRKTENGYVLTDGLANWTIKEGELEESWIFWLVQKERKNEIICPVEEKGALFSNVQEGVYLVKQVETDRQYKRFDPFFLCVPDGETWDIIRSPKVIYAGESPKTGDHPAPIIGAMGIGLCVAVLMVLTDSRKK